MPAHKTAPPLNAKIKNHHSIRTTFLAYQNHVQPTGKRFQPCGGIGFPRPGAALDTSRLPQTPTGKGFGLSALKESPARRPSTSDINPVYQYPRTNRARKGTVM